MSKLQRALIVATFVGVPVFGADVSAPIRDLMKDVMDPFAEGPQRVMFLRLAGVDGEFDEAEFLKDQSNKDGYWQPYDLWPLLMSGFDANRNKRIDWLEARSYRMGTHTVLVAKHDRNKDGKLIGAERDAANKALADGKLKEYFNISCCGGAATVTVDGKAKPVEVPSDPAELKARIEEAKASLGFDQFPPSRPQTDEIHKKRRERAMADKVMFGDEPESTLLPMTQMPTVAELQENLGPHYERELATVMSRDHWDILVKHIHRRLTWEFNRDMGGFMVKSDMMSDYHTGKPARKTIADKSIEQFARQAGGPVHRLGFADQPISVGRRKPVEYYDEGDLSIMPPKLVKKFQAEYLTIKIKMATRFTPAVVYYNRAGLFRGFDLPDDYRAVSFNIMYDPTNASGGPFYPLPSTQDGSFEHPEKDIPLYLHDSK